MHLKNAGCVAGIEETKLDYHIYQATVRVQDLVSFTEVGHSRRMVRSNALRELIRYVGSLRQLVKDVRRFAPRYVGETAPVKLLAKLAARNPSFLVINHRGSNEAGAFSTTVQIFNMLNCTEVTTDLATSKATVAAKVCAYLEQMAAILPVVNIRLGFEQATLRWQRVASAGFRF